MVRLLARVGSHDVRIAHDLGWIAIGDLAARHQHDQALRKCITARMMCSIRMTVNPLLIQSVSAA